MGKKPMQPFAERLRQLGQGLRKRKIDVLQVNMGKYCNQACVHCHVEASPFRTEMMTRETVEAVLHFLERSAIPTMDITGGAPELNPHFDALVDACVRLQRHVVDRCNLTVFFEPGKDYLAGFLRRHRVELTCSLPCYTEANVDRQRGKGTFELSLRALQMLNRLGYGQPETGLRLNLVYNPLSASLPPPQAILEQDYRRHLYVDHGIVFNHLYCLTNMPITRFEKFLRAIGQFEQYQELLASAFNTDTLDRLMCRDLLSIGWDGSVYDCDFNQMLNLPLRNHLGKVVKIWELSAAMVESLPIQVGDQCYACTAGAGSSCGGALLS
jgi:radical SAM/Cys-rich protein